MHDEVTEKRDLEKLMTKDYYADDETEIAYLLERVFTPEDPTKKRDPDREYLKKM